MNRPILLDLFCGAGGAARGYHDAGFDVVGIDIVRQPNYPYEMYVGDALELAPALLALRGEGRFAAVHASPPCRDHTALAKVVGKDGTGWMLAATIDMLAATGLPYVVENVPRARMPGAFTLCGRSFGIARLKRHRRFVSNVMVMAPPCACGKLQPIGVYGDLRAADRDDNGRRRAGVQTARDLLGCPWMEAHELTQAIPPLFTEHIGGWLLDHLAVTA